MNKYNQLLATALREDSHNHYSVYLRRKINRLCFKAINAVAYNVYCGYSRNTHNILCDSGAHSKSLKDLQSKETLAEKLIAGTSFVAFIVLVLLVGAL